MECTSPIECNTIQESPCDIRYLDSRCSNHLTGNLNFFSSLGNSIQTNVTLRNIVQVTILGKGIVGILTKQGECKIMPNGYHVEGLKHNLLSIRQLILKGYRVYIEEICPSNQLV